MALDATPERGADPRWPLTGRATELDRVSSALTAGSGIVLAGPAGVGKTRLLSDCLRRLGTNNVEVRRFSATYVTGRLPFGALAGLLPTGDVFGRERVDLFRAVAAKFVDAARGRRVVLAVDDAHLLDVAGLALLHYLAQEGVVTCALTVRTDPADARSAGWGGMVGVGAVAETRRAIGAYWVDLPPLDQADIDRLLTEVLSARAADDRRYDESRRWGDDDPAGTRAPAQRAG